MEFSDIECIICYSTIRKTLLTPCASCNTVICADCWYEACRMYCPVCCRHEINVPKECRYCGISMHIKDVWACCVCCSWVCKSCEVTPHIHPCRILRDQDCTRLEDAHDIVGLSLVRVMQGYASCPLGRISETMLGATMSENNVVIWLQCKTSSAKQFARASKMKSIQLSHGNILAYKKYYVLHKKCKRFINAFLSKFKSYLLHIEPNPSIIGH
jgi:hypothetical protein